MASYEVALQEYLERRRVLIPISDGQLMRESV